MTDVLLVSWHPLLTLLAKVTVVLGAGVLIASMRKVGPALRHTILLASICGALALPLLSVATPRWNAAILPSTPQSAGSAPAYLTEGNASQDRTSVSGSEPGNAVVAEDFRSPDAQSSNASRSVTSVDWSLATNLVMAAWLLGVVALLARLLAGRHALRVIAARAWQPDDDSWRRLLDEERRLAGVTSSIRLLVSPAASTPVTWGTRFPIVLLPEDAITWSADHRRIVLRHELAHISRGDALAQSIAALLRIVYWFHPLALTATRRLHVECERACDDRVLALGTVPREYASHLLDVARAAHEMRTPALLSLAMARPSQLEGRLIAVLDESRNRTTPTRRAQVSAVVLPLACALVGSAFHPVPRETTRTSRPVAARDSNTERTADTVALVSTSGAPAPELAPRNGMRSTNAASTRAPSFIASDTSSRADVDQAMHARTQQRRTAAAEGFPAASVRRTHLNILLRSDVTLPVSAPVQVVVDKEENLVIVNEEAVSPLHLRAAIEFAKQVRAKYGDDIPGGSVQLAVPAISVPRMRASDAEPYAQLLQQLRRAPLEEINGRPAARHFSFLEYRAVEVALSDNDFASLMNSTLGAGR